MPHDYDDNELIFPYLTNSDAKLENKNMYYELDK